MAKAAKIVEEHTEPVTETITYVPGDGDRPSTQWAGQTFHANVPKELTGHPDGTAQEKLNLHIIETVRRGMKSFVIGDSRPKQAPSAFPKTSDEYKAYMLGWLAKVGQPESNIRSADALIARFAADRELQLVCEVGSDDFAYLGGLFMPKLHELAKADELNQQQVAQLWMSHGINQLPW